MIDLLRALRVHAAYRQRMLGFIPALIIAEIFYKFHSFSLECVAFLATWLVFDLLSEWITGWRKDLAKTRSTGSPLRDHDRIYSIDKLARQISNPKPIRNALAEEDN